MSCAFADHFFKALARLQPREQASVIATVNRFKESPNHPGLRLHPIHSKGAPVYSISDNMDLRIILAKDGGDWVFAHVDHHDAAYRWAERRVMGRNRHTGTFQIVAVEVKTVERIFERPVPAPKTPLFADAEDAYLLSLGLPDNWLPTLRRVFDEDQLLTVCAALSDDVAERLLDLATGVFVTPPTPLPATRPLLEAADAALFVPDNPADLARLLAAPMAQWLAFLHPAQKRLVSRDFSGPAKVSGGAGTGKTVVAMHRARRLAREDQQVLLTTYTNALVNNMNRNMRLLCDAQELAGITVSTVHKQALGLVRSVDPGVASAGLAEINHQLESLAQHHLSGYDPKFIKAEWDHVVRLQGIDHWPAYRRARRTGRGKALGVKERKRLWRVFGGVLAHTATRNRLDWTGMCLRATQLLESGRVAPPFDHVIVDEVQDLKPAELRFLASLCKKPGGLMLCGDAGQRIYPGGFSLAALGLETRGRAAVLRINYRTTAEIKAGADRVLHGDAQDDLEGGLEARAIDHALRRGLPPTFSAFPSEHDEVTATRVWVEARLKEGLEPESIGIFARNNGDLEVLVGTLTRAGIPTVRVDDKETNARGKVALGAMHGAKGLEFKAVLIHGASAEKLPAPYVATLADPLDREHARERERRLLYVAMTRARDLLALSWSGQPSPFLAGLDL